jgi:hypothetical protein
VTEEKRNQTGKLLIDGMAGKFVKVLPLTTDKSKGKGKWMWDLFREKLLFLKLSVLGYLFVGF